jgi:phospholipid/cholesterol/gamma-HCH transport system permease protein
VILRVFEYIGERLLKFVEEMGQIMTILGRTMAWSIRPPFRYQLLIKQFEFVGVQSLFIILLTSIFTGAVFSLQSSYAFRVFDANSMVGPTVALAVTRELGPVLTALLVTGRVGSAIAAEIGTMRVTEQIDAMETLAVSPIQYLIVPRVIASLIMLPALTAIFDIMATVGSWVVCVKLLLVNPIGFEEDLIYFVDFDDFYIGLIKAAVFGLILSTVGCYKGYYTSRGAEGVGQATTQSVVISSVAVLVADYFLTALMF